MNRSADLRRNHDLSDALGQTLDASGGDIYVTGYSVNTFIINALTVVFPCFSAHFARVCT